MNSIINLTQHAASADQIAVGVVDLPQDRQEVLKKLLTFSAPPSPEEIWERARLIAELAPDAPEYYQPNPHVMIGGALWLMGPLAEVLQEQGITPLFAFSVRDTEEQTQADGSVRKVAVFRHAGWIPAV